MCLYSSFFGVHFLFACVAERWLPNQVVTYCLGSERLEGGLLMLIIIKLHTVDNNSVDLLSVHTLFIRLKLAFSSAENDGLHASYEWF